MIITVTKPGYTTVVLPESTPVSYSMVSVGKPVINTQNPVVGETLSVPTVPTYTLNGVVAAATGRVYTWWQGADQVGTGATLLVTAGMVGQGLSVRVTGQKTYFLPSAPEPSQPQTNAVTLP